VIVLSSNLDLRPFSTLASLNPDPHTATHLRPTTSNKYNRPMRYITTSTEAPSIYVRGSLTIFIDTLFAIVSFPSCDTSSRTRNRVTSDYWRRNAINSFSLFVTAVVTGLPCSACDSRILRHACGFCITFRPSLCHSISPSFTLPSK